MITVPSSLVVLGMRHAAIPGRLGGRVHPVAVAAGRIRPASRPARSRNSYPVPRHNGQRLLRNYQVLP